MTDASKAKTRMRECLRRHQEHLAQVWMQRQEYASGERNPGRQPRDEIVKSYTDEINRVVAEIDELKRLLEALT